MELKKIYLKNFLDVLLTLEIVDKTELLNSLNENVASCKDAIFKLFGMSLAGINFILSLLIIVYSFLTLFYEKN